MAIKHPRLYIHIGGLVVVLAAAGFLFTTSSELFAVKYDQPIKKEATDIKGDTKTPVQTPVADTKINQGVVVTHVQPPEAVKSIYMSQCVAGTPSFRDKLITVADTTEINAIVIDIKDYSGRVGYVTDNPTLKDAVSDTCRAPDIVQLIDRLHQKNIYVIGRITVFQDPYMSKIHPERAVRKFSDGGVWKDGKGLSFIDVGSRDHWNYIVELSKESYKMGFDELNYDYIRFPSDGNMEDADYTLSVDKGKTKPQAVEEFFTYLQQQVKPTGVMMSADLFGMTTTSTDDLGIGQVLERALPHFDYVAPMVYPSHYPPQFNGWADPNKFPYDLIKYVMTSAVERANALDRAAYAQSIGTTTPALVAKYTPTTYKKLRPWLQDFDYGGNYDIPEVKAQIKATYDVGLNSWMLWAPSNIYTTGALEK